MISKGINNQNLLLINTANTSKPNGLGEKPSLENNKDEAFTQVAESTLTTSDETQNTKDTVEVYQSAQKLINKLKDYQETNDIEFTEEDKVEDFKDIYFLILNNTQTQLDDKIENLTRDIAYQDLQSEGGIENILTKANLIEGLRDLEQGVKAALEQLNSLTNTSNEHGLEPSLVNDLKFQVDNFIQKSQDQIINNGDIHIANEANLTSDLKTHNQQNYQDLLALGKTFKLEIKDYKEITSKPEENIDPTLLINPEETNPITQGTSERTNTPKVLEAKQEIHISLAPEQHDSGSAHADSQQQHFGSAFAHNIGTESVLAPSIEVKVETVNIKDLTNYLEVQVQETPVSGTQEIKLQITPDSIGKVDLTISKNENNEITVHMSFHNRDGLESIKHDLKDAIAELREVLKSKNLDLSKFEVQESGTSRTAYDGESNKSSFNQARDEQKQKLQNTIPEWVKQKDSSKHVSFREIVEGI